MLRPSAQAPFSFLPGRSEGVTPRAARTERAAVELQRWAWQLAPPEAQTRTRGGGRGATPAAACGGGAAAARGGTSAHAERASPPPRPGAFSFWARAEGRA